MGHGSFLLSNNGYTWSHYYPEDNIHSSQFVFKEGNTVELTLDPKELTFKVNDNPIPFKLRIEYKAEEWPQVCFCANLCSQGDSVQILDQWLEKIFRYLSSCVIIIFEASGLVLTFSWSISQKKCTPISLSRWSRHPRARKELRLVFTCRDRSDRRRSIDRATNLHRQ